MQGRDPHRVAALFRAPAPVVAWAYGLAGLAPFAGACAWALAGPVLTRPTAQVVQLIYAGLILSFLGGARWGLEIARSPVRARIITLSMLPTLAAFALVAAVAGPLRLRLALMAAAFAVQGAWDMRSVEPPPWYPALRLVLTLGACLTLVLAAAFGPN